jgi:hypothetical protein
MANNLDALNPEYWSPRLQTQLEKALIGKAICNFEIQLPDGDKFHRPYHSDLTAGTYTRNATSGAGGAVVAQDVTTTDEYLLVDTAKYVSFKIDRLDSIQNKYKIANRLAKRGGYTLRDIIDIAVLAEYANADLVFDGADLGGAAGPITVSTSNIFQIFSGVRKLLAKANIPEENDFFAIISPDVFEILEQYATGKGFKIPDDVIPNGYKGRPVDGFELYVSNNLTETTDSATKTQHCLFGKKGAIDLVIQQQPNTEKLELPQNTDGSVQLATQYIVWTLFGIKTFAEGARRLVDVQINSTSF